jgi:hypothetical protein
MAKITHYKYQFACLLQDAQGNQLPVIFYDKDAASIAFYKCMMKIYATNSLTTIGDIPVQFSTSKVSVCSERIFQTVSH